MNLGEKFIMDKFSNLYQYTHHEHRDYIFYKENNVLLFKYDKSNNILYCDYTHFWKILKESFKIDREQINILNKIYAKYYLNLDNVKSLYVTKFFIIDKDEEYLIKEHELNSRWSRLLK